MKNIDVNALLSLSKEEIIKQFIDCKNDLLNCQNQLESKQKELDDLTSSIDELIRKNTIEVTNKVTDKVTIEVTEKVKKEMQIKIDKLLKKLLNKNLTISRYNRELFDSKSEHLKREEKDDVINEAEKEMTVKKTRKGTKNFKDIDLEKLVKKVTVVDVDVKNDPNVKVDLIKIGEDISYKLHRIPASFCVEKIITPKYINKDTEEIVQAISDRVFPHSILTPSLAASIIDSKLSLAIPLDRQARYLKKHGFNISQQTLSNWYMLTGELLTPLYNKLKEHLINNSSKCIFADETVLKVLDNEDIGRKNSYIFCYISSFYDNPIFIYDFQMDRGKEHIKDMLEGFNGYLHCDGYPGYNILKQQGVKLCRCYVHARREFLNIIKGMKEEKAKNTKAYQVVKLFNNIFSLNEKTKSMTANEIYNYRNSKVFRSAINKLHDYVYSLNPEKDSPLDKAVTYFKNAYDDMLNIFLDGHVELTNNASERAIKPFVIDRKNFLFCKTNNGATITAILFSIIQTASANFLRPDVYLEYVIDNINKKPIEELLPWSNTLPEEIHVHSKDIVKRKED